MRTIWLRNKVENAVNAFFSMFQHAMESRIDSVPGWIAGAGSVTGPGIVRDSNLGDGSIEAGEGSLAASCAVAAGSRLVLGRNVLAHDISIECLGDHEARLEVHVGDGSMLCGVDISINTRVAAASDGVARLYIGQDSRIADSSLNLNCQDSNIEVSIGDCAMSFHSGATFGRVTSKARDKGSVRIGERMLLYNTYLHCASMPGSSTVIGKRLTVIDRSSVSDAVKFAEAAMEMDSGSLMFGSSTVLNAQRAVIGDDLLVVAAGDTVEMDAMRLTVGDNVSILSTGSGLALKYKAVSIGSGANIVQLERLSRLPAVDASSGDSLVRSSRRKAALSVGCGAMLVLSEHGHYAADYRSAYNGNVYVEAGKRFVI